MAVALNTDVALVNRRGYCYRFPSNCVWFAVCSVAETFSDRADCITGKAAILPRSRHFVNLIMFRRFLMNILIEKNTRGAGN